MSAADFPRRRGNVTKTASLVLVVDDDESMRALLKMQMELDGYRVVTAEHGAKALAECEAKLPDLVLLDALMPEWTASRLPNY